MKVIVKEQGFSFLDAIILVNVCENPGATQEQIANKLVLDNASVARSLKQMEHRRLIRRVIDPENQRTKKIYALQKGETAKKEMDRIRDYWNNIFLCDFAEQEQEEIVSTLQKLQQKAIDIDLDKIIQEYFRTKNNPRII